MATLFLSLAAAAPAPVTMQVPMPVPDIARVAIVTDVGVIALDLDGKRAPITTANFLRYASRKRFDGTVFYRAMRLPWGTAPNGLIQGGTQMNATRILGPIAHEPTTLTGLHHTAGTISMARYAPGTATGDFTIMLSDMSGLDADPHPETAAPGADTAGFAAFGHVVEGMDVVRRIYDAPLSPTQGHGVMRGQMLAQPVRIVSVRQVALPPPAAAVTP